METFDVWFNRTLAESGVGPEIADPATVRRLVALLEATPSPSSAPAQLDAA